MTGQHQHGIPPQPRRRTVSSAIPPRPTAAPPSTAPWPNSPAGVQRPAAGPRGVRPIWTGKDEQRRREALTTAAADDSAGTTTRSFERAIIASPRVHERSGRGRVLGVDAARGMALLGIFAVHLAPAYNEEADRATVSWVLFAGNASALFAVLAGLALALITGGPTPFTGLSMRRAKVKIATRGLLLTALGVALNMLDLPVFNILVYLAVMFMMAIPFVGMSRKTLLIMSVAMMVVLPLVRYGLHVLIEGAGRYPNPVPADISTDTLGVLATLTITGAYPAFTWIAFVLLGLAIGRFGVQRSGSRLGLIVSGVLTSSVVTAVSLVLIHRFNGYSHIMSALPGATEDEVDEFIVFGPTGPLPTDGPGWLLAVSPHSNTPFALLIGAGFSRAAIGGFILLSRHWSALLKPLIDMGSMTTTMYVGHLVFMLLAPDSVPGTALFWLQALGALLFATMWRVVWEQGPLEVLISSASKAVGRTAVPQTD